MQLIKISSVLAAALASLVQARSGRPEPHLNLRQYDNGEYLVTSPVSSVPLGTGASSAVGVSNATFSYALGSGVSTTVVTTTIKGTATFTRVNTVYLTRGAGGYGHNTTSAGPTVAEPTTTVTKQSTTTKTVIIESVGASSGSIGVAQPTGSAADGYAPSPAGSAGDGLASLVVGCAPVITVTETIKSTITVTATPAAATSKDAGPVSSSSVVLVLPSGSIAGYHNGTVAKPTTPKRKCASSGFLTKSKPTALPPGYKKY